MPCSGPSHDGNTHGVFAEYATFARDLFDGVLEPGRHRVPLDGRAVKGEAYPVARTGGTVRVTALAR